MAPTPSGGEVMSKNMMKALIKEEPKESYVLKEIPIPEPKADEILFKVEKVSNLILLSISFCCIMMYNNNFEEISYLPKTL